jgi:hypothetical protein
MVFLQTNRFNVFAQALDGPMMCNEKRGRETGPASRELDLDQREPGARKQSSVMATLPLRTTAA